jgi:phosphate acetyltransferase
MQILNQIRMKASELNRSIVLPRGSDIRVLKAAAYLEDHGMCTPIVLGDKVSILEKCRAHGIKLGKGVILMDPQNDSRRNEYSEFIYKKRKHKGLSKTKAKELSGDPLYFGACLLANGEADGCVAGSVSTTADVLKVALQIIGLKADSEVVSSTFLMSFKDGRTYTYADAAVVPYPDAKQLASICMDSAQSHRKLTGQEPIVAMLSFSTKGSARHARVALVIEALEEVEARNPDFIVDGELQFDAAFVESVAKRKAPLSPVGGRANVFIFPNLDAGNIAYKMTERLAGATATGPIIQGLKKPMMDLSRGCNWVDIVDTVCVCAVMS